MKFNTKAEAVRFAKAETNRTHWKHKAVPARWQGPDLEWHDCWTVILAVKQ